MSNIFVDFIKPNSGRSHKRLIATLSALVVIGLAIADAFADLTIDPVLLEVLKWMALGGMGTSVLERFAPTTGQAKTTMETKTTIVEPADVPPNP